MVWAAGVKRPLTYAPGRLPVGRAAGLHSHAVLVVPDDEGYPLSVATSFKVIDTTVEITPVSTGTSLIRDTIDGPCCLQPHPSLSWRGLPPAALGRAERCAVCHALLMA